MNYWKSTPAPYRWMYCYKLSSGEFATVEQSVDRKTWYMHVYKSRESYEAFDEATDYWPFDLKRDAVHFLKYYWSADEPTVLRDYHDGY